MCRALLDNDIVAKTVTYQLVSGLISVLGVSIDELGVLGTLVYVISAKRLQNANDGGDNAVERLKAFLKCVHVLEPTESESQLAIVFEEAAQLQEVDLDVGESQLFAMAVSREVQKVCTGDKRAITAAEELLPKIGEIEALVGRLVPLEELAHAMVKTIGYDTVRKCICDAKGTDRALEICFQCHNRNGNPEETEAGLRSYLSSLRRAAPSIFGNFNSCS